MRLDHVVLWTKDPAVAMDFYTRVVGLAPVRFDEFEAGEAPFPSVRVSDDSIIDLSPIDKAGGTETQTHVAGSAGHPVNHVCLAMTRAEYEALDQRLRADDLASHRQRQVVLAQMQNVGAGCPGDVGAVVDGEQRAVPACGLGEDFQRGQLAAGLQRPELSLTG